MKKKLFVMILIFIIGFIYNMSAFAQEKRKKTKIFSIEDKNNTGLIFNVNDIRMDIESYQGGVGIKHFYKDKTAYRGSLDFSYSDSSSTWVFNLGNSIERHLIEGRVSPYIGVLLDVGFIRYKTETDADNWTKSTAIPLSAGPIFGVEVTIFNYLSLFAEYSMTVSYTRNITQQSVAGVVTKDSDGDFSTEIGIGNESKIGIVLYFYNIKRKDKEKVKDKRKDRKKKDSQDDVPLLE